MNKIQKLFVTTMAMLICLLALSGCSSSKKESEPVKTEAENVMETKIKSESKNVISDSKNTSMDVSNGKKQDNPLEQIVSLEFSPDEISDYKEILDYFGFKEEMPIPNQGTGVNVILKYEAVGYDRDSYTGTVKDGVARRKFGLHITSGYGKYEEEILSWLNKMVEYWKTKNQGVFLTGYRKKDGLFFLLNDGTEVSIGPLTTSHFSIIIREGEAFELKGTIKEALYEEINEENCLTEMQISMEDGRLVKIGKDSEVLIHPTAYNVFERIPWLRLPEKNLEEGSTVLLKGYTFERGESTYSDDPPEWDPISLGRYFRLGNNKPQSTFEEYLVITEISIQ